MKTYLEYNDEKSNKFWQIEVSLNKHTVRYGKVGTVGTTQNKTFNSEEETLKDAKKLIASKIKKGYVEVKLYLPKENRKKAAIDYKHIINTKDLHKALCKHFSYLADTPGFEPILSAIMQKAHNARFEENVLIVSFPGDDELIASSPADISKYENWPESFQKCVAVHEYLSFPEDGWSLYLGDAGNFEADYLEEDESDLLDYIDAEDVLCPIADYSDWWLYHPGKKNVFGEDSLCFFSHDGGDLEKPVAYNVGSLFLKMVAENLNLEIEIPENISEKDNSVELRTWWENLSDDWKTAFKDCLDIENDKELKDKELKKIINAKKFYSHESELSLRTLEPLNMLKKLETINLSRQKEITDLSPLENLSELEDLNISDAQVTNIECLINLKQLWRLELTNMPIEDINSLSNLKKIEQLDISKTKVKDLSAISKLPKLEQINISDTQVETLEQLVGLKKMRDIDLARTTITDLSPLSKFKKISRINIDRTEISDLSPLYAVKGIYIIHTQESKVSFQELMKFVFHHLEDYTGGDLGIDIYSEYLMDNDIFLKELENIDFELAELGEVLSVWVNDKIISAVKRNEKEFGETMLSTFIKLLPMVQSEFIKEQLLVNSLALLFNSESKQLLEKVMNAFMPKKITTGLLAFNLACLHASNKVKLLEYTKLALQLGQEPNRFIEDTDFKDCMDDPDFIDLLSNPQTPGPDEDIDVWWSSLDENWQDNINWQMGYPETLEEIKLQETMTCRETTNLEPLRYFIGLKLLTAEYSAFTSIDALQYLVKLESLAILGDDYLSKSKIKSLEPIRNLLNLKFLRITHQNIFNLSPLENLTKLESLNLFSLPINNINPIKNLINLKTLHIGGKCDIKGIDVLENCVKLEKFSVSGKTLKNIKVLGKLIKLTEINISHSLVEDLNPISNCKELKELRCYDCPITSLKPLENLTELTELNLGDTKVPEEEIKDFVARHPKCKVDYRAV